MQSSISGFRTLFSVALAAATGIATYTGNAQENSTKKTEEITVEAARPGRSAIGAPINTVTTRRVVNYADVSLTTASGVKVLENRIHEAARSACAELEQKYPVAAEGDTTQKCIEKSVEGPMVNARKAVDAAKVASDID